MDVELLTFEHEETHDLVDVARLKISFNHQVYYFHQYGNKLFINTGPGAVVVEPLGINQIQLSIKEFNISDHI